MTSLTNRITLSNRSDFVPLLVLFYFALAELAADLPKSKDKKPLG